MADEKELSPVVGGVVVGDGARPLPIGDGPEQRPGVVHVGEEVGDGVPEPSEQEPEKYPPGVAPPETKHTVEDQEQHHGDGGVERAARRAEGAGEVDGVEYSLGVHGTPSVPQIVRPDIVGRSGKGRQVWQRRPHGARDADGTPRLDAVLTQGPGEERV